MAPAYSEAPLWTQPVRVWAFCRLPRSEPGEPRASVPLLPLTGPACCQHHSDHAGRDLPALQTPPADTASSQEPLSPGPGQGRLESTVQGRPESRDDRSKHTLLTAPAVRWHRVGPKAALLEQTRSQRRAGEGTHAGEASGVPSVGLGSWPAMTEGPGGGDRRLGVGLSPGWPAAAVKILQTNPSRLHPHDTLPRRALTSWGSRGGRRWTGALWLQAWSCPGQLGGRAPWIPAPCATGANLGALQALWGESALLSLLPARTCRWFLTRGSLLSRKPATGLREGMPGNAVSGPVTEGVDGEGEGQDVGSPQGRSSLRN